MAYKTPEKRRQYHKKWRENNKDRIRQYAKNYEAKKTDAHFERERELARGYSATKYGDIKRKVFELYGGGTPTCACCGEEEYEFLTIEHIGGGGNKERNRVGWGNTFYAWLIKQPVDKSKYKILCYNCNCFRRSKYQNPVCPHKR